MIFFCHLYLFCSIFIEAIKIDGNVLIKREEFRPYKTGLKLDSIEDIRRISKKWRSFRFEDIIEEDKDLYVPPAFDSGDVWPQCKSIKRIRDQGNCGWCWAVTTASTVTDRLCISTNGSDTFEYSAVYLLTCCKNCTGGADNTETLRKDPCKKGGSPYTAMYFLGHSGGLSEDCIPWTPSITKDALTPPCQHKCTEPNKTIKHAEKKILKGAKFILTMDNTRLEDIKQIQIDIMLNGPVMAALQSPSHFENFFKNGKNSDAIYRKTEYKNATEKEISHLVKMVGWGQENEILYWICANSWGTNWGNKGFFKIIRGENLLEIEGAILAPYHKLPPPPTTTTSKSFINLNYSCAKMVTIPKSIFLLAVIIFL